jgi:hypothetical protein
MNAYELLMMLYQHMQRLLVVADEKSFDELKKELEESEIYKEYLNFFEIDNADKNHLFAIFKKQYEEANK